MSRTALVTGASSGIGREVARLLVARGYRVIGTSRDPESLSSGSRVPGVEYLALDLADDASIRACAEAAGGVDILVNNAGESQCGPLEELPADAIEHVFALNVFGPVKLTQLVLPGMRERRYGRVVMVGSMLASFPVAFRSSYAATKAAIKGFATSARTEVTPYGVHITTVEPGSINTGISSRRTKYIRPDSVYRADFDTVIAALDHKESTGIGPEQVARTIVSAIEAHKPKPLYAVGSNAPIVFTLKRLVPDTVLEKVSARMFGLRR